MNLKPVRTEAKIVVPSSSANVGPGFDCWCLGLRDPWLSVTCRLRGDGRLVVQEKSGSTVRSVEVSSHSGGRALEYFLRSLTAGGEGLDVVCEDEGYPVGKGLGRSGAEAVGAVAAAAAIYGLSLSRAELIFYSGFGEPGADTVSGRPGHLDNVSGSANGRFNIVATSPRDGRVKVFPHRVPASLGVAVGYSSFEKAGGTGALRKVIENPVTSKSYVDALGWVSAATAGLVSGNVDQFLEFLWDPFHEPRRADAGGYGPFDSKALFDLKKRLYRQYGVVMNVSGAGPNLLFLYNRVRAELWKGRGKLGYVAGFSSLAEGFFSDYGVKMEVRPGFVAAEGGYDFLVKQYGVGKVPVGRLLRDKR